MIGTCLGMIFLSTPSARRATVASVTGKHRVLFLSTPSARRATYADPLARRQPRNFYPRPPRGGRLHTSLQFRPLLVISIHALREEGDEVVYSRGEIVKAFLSTPSAGRATGDCLEQGVEKEISIHALRGEGDKMLGQRFRLKLKFLSTPSAGRATSAHIAASAAKHYFYPRPPRGGRLAGIFKESVLTKFLSTPSAGRATFRRCTI